MQSIPPRFLTLTAHGLNNVARLFLKPLWWKSREAEMLRRCWIPSHEIGRQRGHTDSEGSGRCERGFVGDCQGGSGRKTGLGSSDGRGSGTKIEIPAKRAETERPWACDDLGFR